MEKVNFNVLWAVGAVAALLGRFIMLWLQKRRKRKADEEVVKKE
jgi:cytochrome c-type biogenesis protein CcmH/NrfF